MTELLDNITLERILFAVVVTILILLALVPKTREKKEEEEEKPVELHLKDFIITKALADNTINVKSKSKGEEKAFEIFSQSPKLNKVKRKQ